MDKLEATPPEFSIPADPAGKVEVSRNGSKEEFGIVVPDKNLFLVFYNELYRRWKMWAMLDKAAKRYETGEVNMANAADNLEKLLGEREKLGERAVAAARGFWEFTDARGDKERITRIEKLFEPHGQTFIEMVGKCCGAILVTGGDSGN
jgi:hypothetical protein